MLEIKLAHSHLTNPIDPPIIGGSFLIIMTVEELLSEVELLTKENVRHYPVSRTFKDDFLSCWQNHGRQVALYYAMPGIWEGRVPRPSEVFNG